MLSVSRKLLYYHVLRLQSRPINKTHETSKYCIWNTFLWHLNKLLPQWQLNYFLTVYIAFPHVMDRFEMWWMDEKQLMKWVTGFGGPLNQPRIFTSSSILSSNVPEERVFPVCCPFDWFREQTHPNHFCLHGNEHKKMHRQTDLFPPDKNEPPHLRGQSKPILREMLRRGRCSTSLSDWHIAGLHGQLDHFGFNCKILIVDLAHVQSKKLSWWLFMGFTSNQLPWQIKDQNEEGAWMLLEWFSSVSNYYRYNSSGARVEEWWRWEGLFVFYRFSLFYKPDFISVQFNIKV